MRNEDGIRVRWSKHENDWYIHYPRKSDGWLTYDLLKGHDTFQKWIKQLEERGYDLTTLRISVRLKEENVNGS